MEKKTVFFTGANPAALAAAGALAADGWEVYVNASCDMPEGVRSVSVDTWDRSAVLRFMRSLTGLCAAVIVPQPPEKIKILECTDEKWAENRDKGAYSALVCTQAAGEVFYDNKTSGTILYLSTIHAEKPTGGSFLHSIEAGAEQMLCREAAGFYGRFGVKVHYLMLGPIEGTYDAFANERSGIYHGVEEQMPDGRPITPDDVVPLIRFLLSDGAWPLNGSDIRADKGFTLYFNSFREEAPAHHE